MSCPFYGRSLVVLVQSNAPLLITQEGNRCALIISAHSPCWMEVGEDRKPEWSDCPRNPEWMATSVPPGPEMMAKGGRIAKAINWLNQMMSMRSHREQ